MISWTLTERDIMTYAATNEALLPLRQDLAQSGLAHLINQVFISEQLQTQKPDALFYEKIGASKLLDLVKKRRWWLEIL